MSVPDYMMQKERPLGISILSVLHFIGGIGFIIASLCVLLLLRDPKIAEKLSALGCPIPLLVGAMLFIAVLSFASSVGMWNGDRWGWYLGSFWYAFSIIRDVNALLAVNAVYHSFPQDPSGNAAHGIAFYYTKFAIRLVISLLLYLYFFKPNVREYFRLHESKRWIAVAIQFFLGIDIIFAISAWYKFAQ